AAVVPTAKLAARPVGAKFRSDRILLKPKSKVDLQTIGRLHARSRAHVVRTFPKIGNLQILQLPPGVEVRDFIAAYRQSDLVEYAEPDYTVELLLAPDDPAYLDGTLWNLYNTGLAGADIHAA